MNSQYSTIRACIWKGRCLDVYGRGENTEPLRQGDVCLDALSTAQTSRSKDTEAARSQLTTRLRSQRCVVEKQKRCVVPHKGTQKMWYKELRMCDLIYSWGFRYRNVHIGWKDAAAKTKWGQSMKCVAREGKRKGQAKDGPRIHISAAFLLHVAQSALRSANSQ